MPTLLEQILQNLGERLDAELLPSIYASVALRTAEVRAELREAGLACYDPEAGQLPGEGELALSAEAVIDRSTRNATLSGAVAGLAGAAALPPEVAVTLVRTLRLGQRLAVIYGHDPETERGKLILWMAVAAAWEVKLPEQASLDLRVRALPDLLREQVPALRLSMGAFGQTVATRALVTMGRRTLRLLPGLGAGLGAWDARRRLRAHGARMLRVVQRAWEGGLVLDGPIEDAVEVFR